MRRNTVSVVIPTRNRPEMVVAAVRSALAEPVAEVIVVVDGPEDEAATQTPSTLGALSESRLRVIALDQSVGGSEARNIGVRAAVGEWVGFLDDDDLWLPGKIAAQLRLAESLYTEWPVVSCAVLARTPVAAGQTRRTDRVWPRQLYRQSEPMSEYLFCRSGWTYGAGLLQTSTLLMPRRLVLRLPFTTGLKKHQDWDWLLRVAAEPDVEVAMAPEPLVVFHVEGQRKSVGRAADWQFSYRWAVENRRLFTTRAFQSFVATECAPQAARSGASSAERLHLLRALFADGRPSVKTLLLCIAFLLVPQQVRRGMRDAARYTRAGLSSS